MILFFPIGTDAAAATATPGIDLTGLDIVREALLEIGVLNPTQDVGPDDAPYGLSKLNRILDRWNADGRMSFATAFTDYTLTAARNPHTIGPSGHFVVPITPTKIASASLVIGDERHHLKVRSQAWYAGLSDPESTSDIPTDLYYESAVPDGKIWLYPAPSAAQTIEIWTPGKLAGLELTDQLYAPDGYRDALIKTLAEELVAPFRVPMPQGLPMQAREARAIIFNNNLVIPPLCTRDHGMGGGSGSWNKTTGDVE